MKTELLVKNCKKEEIIKEILYNKAKTFLNKKRKSSSNAEPFDITDSEMDVFLEENFNNIFTNTKSFNNLNLSNSQQLTIIPPNKKIKVDIIDQPTNFSTLNNKKDIEWNKIIEIDNTNILNIDDEENKDNINTTINSNCPLSIKKEEKVESNEIKSKENIKNPSFEKKEKIIENQNKKNLLGEEKTNKNKNDGSLEDVPENKNNSKHIENINRNNIELIEKDDLCCFALDLLHKNGEFQIKFSEKTNSIYLLKIKEVEIKDDYFEQVEYAKKYGKKSSLMYTAPNSKFWNQRYYYYSKFDKGIMMDRESWYSVTPEKIAKYTAKLIEGKTIIDGFCGSGGNVIQFSKYCSKVYAIDISKNKLSICRNNCDVYNCKDNIKFIHSDFLKMKNKIKADYIFLSPPWGGTEYKNSNVYSIKKFMYPDITDIIRVSLNVANNILFFLPRNLDLDELFDLCSQVKNEIKEGAGKELFFDIQIIKSNNRIKSLLIIFGHNIKDYFSRHKLEKFVERYYGTKDSKNIDYLYSVIKIIGHFRFFKEEYIYRTEKSKDSKLSELSEYIKNNCLSENEIKKINNIK